jgi:NADPH-dependent glutamate synthase beta subunit-like oxidoreductase
VCTGAPETNNQIHVPGIGPEQLQLIFREAGLLQALKHSLSGLCAPEACGRIDFHKLCQDAACELSIGIDVVRDPG